MWWTVANAMERCYIKKWRCTEMKVTVHLEKLTSGLHDDKELRDFKLLLLCSIMPKKRSYSWLWTIQIWERYCLRQGHFYILDCGKDIFSNVLNIQILHLILWLLKVKHGSCSDNGSLSSGLTFPRQIFPNFGIVDFALSFFLLSDLLCSWLHYAAN